jgi:hypothetical protein
MQIVACPLLVEFAWKLPVAPEVFVSSVWEPLPTGPHGPRRYNRYASLRFSVNLDRHSHGNLINYSSRVPVCQTDAPVAGRTTDRIRAVGTVNADALFVHTNPDDPTGLRGPGGIV